MPKIGPKNQTPPAKDKKGGLVAHIGVEKIQHHRSLKIICKPNNLLQGEAMKQNLKNIQNTENMLKKKRAQYSQKYVM